MIAPAEWRHPRKAVEVDRAVATDERMRHGGAKRAWVIGDRELGHAVHVEVGAELEAGREHLYHFTIGRLSAAPRGAGGRCHRRERRWHSSFRRGRIQRYEDGYFTAYRYIAAERFDFVFHYGDYIYEYRVARPGDCSRARRPCHAR